LAALALAWSGGASAEGVCRYDVKVGLGLALDVAVACETETGNVAFDPSSAPFADFVTGFAARGQGARYRLDLAAWAARANSIDVAYRAGWSVVAPAAGWLLAPVTDEPMMLEVRIAAEPEIIVASAAMGGDGVARYDNESLAYAGFTVFGGRRDRLLEVPSPGGRAVVDVAELDGALDLDPGVLDAWIAGRITAAGRLWHGAPARPLLVVIVPVADAGGVIFGISRGGGGAGVALFLGQHTEPSDLEHDWVLAHELVHVGMPFLPDAFWFMEGAAVYLEPVLRARAGLLKPDAVWRGFANHLGEGADRLATTPLGAMGFPGLYLSGGAFMLALDVEARRASAGRVGLEDCLRTVRARLGDSTGQASLESVIAVCDEVLGDGLMTRFVDRHARAAAALDLPAIMAALGVHTSGGDVVFDDGAPDAWIRRAITGDGP
jgi:hypothetical protein